MTIEEFSDKYELVLVSNEQFPYKAEEDIELETFVCVLRYKNRQIELPYGRIALDEPPNLIEVLESYHKRCICFKENKNFKRFLKSVFEDFEDLDDDDEFECNVDDIEEAKGIWETIEFVANSLLKLFGKKIYQEFLNCENKDDDEDDEDDDDEDD